MLFDRQPRRILLGHVVVSCLLFAAGCHSTMLQPVATTPTPKSPDNPPTTTAGSGSASPTSETKSAERTQLPDVPKPMSALATLPPRSPDPAPVTLDPPRIDLALVKASASEPIPVTTAAQTTPAPGDPTPPLPASATPMLEAALHRAEEIERQTIRDAAASPVETVGPVPNAVSGDKSDPKPSLVALETPPQVIAKQDPKLQKAETTAKDATPQPALETNKAAVKSVEREASLKIGEARFCRRVLKFGSVEELKPEDTLKAGQSIDLYAELGDVKYDRIGDEFRSRIASRLELFRATGSEASQPLESVWVDTPSDVEDHCQKICRDYYLNYRITLPEIAEPGNYVLRLSVTDLVSNHLATTQIPLTIAP